jgi:hypothetical protein
MEKTASNTNKKEQKGIVLHSSPHIFNFFLVPKALHTS